MNTETLVDNSLSSVLATVTQSLVDATKQYGPDAVELGLLVYRVEASKQLLGAFVATILLTFAWGKWIVFVKACKNWESEGQAVPRILGTLILGFLTALLSVAVIPNLINPFYWVAALGSPEVLVAYKALEAAGLM